MRVKFKVENTTHLYMPKLNGNFTLRQILTILPYFRPDTNIDISFQSISYPGYSSACWKTERTNSRHEFSYTSQETPCKRVCFKKYASLLTMVRYIKTVKNHIFWHPTNLYSWCKLRSPSLFDSWGHYLLPFSRTTLNLSDLCCYFVAAFWIKYSVTTL